MDYKQKQESINKLSVEKDEFKNSRLSTPASYDQIYLVEINVVSRLTPKDVLGYTPRKVFFIIR